MYDLKWLLKCMDRIPLFVVKLSSRDGICGTSRIVFTVVTVVAIIYMINEVTQSEIKDTQSFVNVAHSTMAIMAVSCWVLHLWSQAQDIKVTIQDVYSFDQTFETGCRTSVDAFISCAVFLQMAIWGTSIFQVIYLYHMSANFFFKYVTGAVAYTYTVQIWLLKHLLNKRFKAIQTWIEEGEDPLSLVFMVRKLIDLNIRVNIFFSTMITSSLGFNFTAVMRNVSTLWILFRLQKESPIISVGILLGLYNLQLLWMVLECSTTSGLVVYLEREIDRVISNRRRPLNRRKHLMALLQELHHSPTVLTCMDFFTVDPSSVSVLCGLVINALMVFIQFMHE